MTKYCLNSYCAICGAEEYKHVNLTIRDNGSPDLFCDKCGEFTTVKSRVEWWHSTAYWYKPWTWLSGLWMPKDGWIKP